MERTKRKLPRTVFVLGLVSLLTDASSEMIYPLLPLFLTALGAGPQVLGFIEGIAESTSSILKLVGGRLSDRRGRRKPFVLAGYGLSGFVRPLTALAATPAQVLAIRFSDRVGKGLRTSPRDAMIGGATEATQRGRAYGFHRAMDHAGAVIGPLLAAGIFLALGSEEGDIDAMRIVFLLAAIPALMAFLAIVFFVREPRGEVRAVAHSERRPLHRRLKAFLAVVFLLNLSLSSDAFVLLRAQELGVTAAQIPLLWAFHHVVKVLAGTPGGTLSDRVGRRTALNLGYAVYIASYVLLAFASEAWHAWAIMAVYALYFGLTEGAEKALVNDLARGEQLGSAFGAYHLVVGMAAFPASALFGLLWEYGGPRPAFLAGASLALAGIVFLNIVLRSRKEPPS